MSMFSIAQVVIDDSQSIVDMVKRLEGDGVIIENITYSYDLETDTLRNPIGTFLDTVGALGMSNGILLTNGAAKNAEGPNNFSAKSQENLYDIYDDAELQNLVLENQTIQDLTIIEFDITVYASKLSFNYVFASEEYPEFLEFNDVFGFFLSGPGINGVENLAVIPGTNTAVSVSNINQEVNSQFYISNGTGETPFDNRNLQYDGYTTVLKAQRDVIPCETYHIKLAIADVNDSNLDSGVFLEEGSFNSKKLPYFEVFYEYDRFDHLIEGCNNAQVNIVRDPQDLGVATQFEILVEGTATQGVDFDSISLVYFFGANDLFQFFNLNTIIDNVDDSYESIKLTLLSDCDKFEYFDIIEIDLKEKYIMTLDPLKKCGPTPILLNDPAITTDYYEWTDTDQLSCFKCPSPSTDILMDSNFTFYVYDSISGCEGDGSQFVEYEEIIADFNFTTDECNTTIDFDFNNLSVGADIFSWDFGDGNLSFANSPSHTFKEAINGESGIDFIVTLTVANSETGCTNLKRESVIINEPLFSPNVISPNNDFINDEFHINGINENCWTIEVFNRWGKLVIEESPFTNAINPIDLSDGTYYYRIYNDNGNREFKGYFNVFK